MRLFESAKIARANFVIRTESAERQDPELGAYLRSANIQIVSVAPSMPMLARLTLFPHLTFAHLNGPRVSVRWPRDEYSLDRVLVLVCRTGGLEVRIDDTLIRRGPGVILVPPGRTNVAVTMTEPDNEVLYVSVATGLLENELAPMEAPAVSPQVDGALLQPPLLFIAALCQISVNEAGAASPLMTAAVEVARALVRATVDGSAPRMSLFARATEIIVTDYPDVNLSVRSIGRDLGVAPRTIQAAFQAEGVTVAAMVRDVRVRAAQNLRAGDAGLPPAVIARSVGFGSPSSLYRALKTSAGVREQASG